MDGDIMHLSKLSVNDDSLPIINVGQHGIDYNLIQNYTHKNPTIVRRVERVRTANNVTMFPDN